MTAPAAPSVLPPALSRSASAAFGASLGDSPRLASLRSEGAESACRMALPTRADRQWKYLDLEDFTFEPFAPGQGALVLPKLEELTDESAGVLGSSGTIELLDGNPITLRALPSFTLADFREPGAAVEAVERELGSRVGTGLNLFAALHWAFLQGGVVVYVPANVELALPVRILRRFTADGRLAAPHTLIVTGANSRVTVIEDCTSTDGDLLVLPAVEIVPGDGSTVHYVVVHRWSENTQVFAEQRTVTARDSSLTSLAVALGGSVVKSHITSSLEGRGSSSELYALNLGRGERHCDFYTLQDHIAPDTRSDLLFKSALKDDSRSVYYGLTRVGLGGRRANANQENRNLLLSKTAKADSDPVLEILTNDVIQASHGATAGPVDQEQLFYLQARCLSRPDAESLLVSAFLGEVLDRMKSETLHDELAELLQTVLEA